jgi:hypothetical protein
MPSVNNNINDTYKKKMLVAEILERLSGDYFASQIFNSQMALDPRKGMASQFGNVYTFEKEASTTYRKLTAGGSLNYDDTPQITNVDLTVDTFSYVGLQHNEFDRAAFNDTYISNYAQARARDLAVNMEKDIISNILATSTIPVANTLNLANYTDGKLNQDTMNDALTVLRDNGHTGGSRVFAVLDTQREGNLRGALSVYDKTGSVADRQLLTSRIIDIYGIETYGVLGSGTFDRMPTNTTSDGVSGTGDIVGFVISEMAYKINGIQLPDRQPGVDITTVNNPNIPLGLRRVVGYDMDTMTNKDVLGLWWGDLVVYPELIVPIVAS